jgi:hypothetical protein
MEQGEEAYTKAPIPAEGKPDPAPRIGHDEGHGKSEMTPEEASKGDRGPNDGKPSMLGRFVDAARSAFQAPDTRPRQPDSIRTVTNPRDGIKVVALRPGYFNQTRKVEGDIFFIPDMKMLGDWMALADPRAEQKRREKEKQAGR